MATALIGVYHRILEGKKIPLALKMMCFCAGVWLLGSVIQGTEFTRL